MLHSDTSTLSSKRLLPKIEMTQAKVGDRFLLMVEDAKHKAFGERVTQRMRDLSLTTGDVRTNLNVTYEMARRYGLGSAFPRPAKLDQLAKLLQVSSAWLAFGSNEQPMEETEFASLAPWDDTTPKDDDEVDLPFFKECRFSTGPGESPTVELNGRKLRFARSTLKAYGIDPENAACGTASGNSMHPYIQDGATVGIDLARTQIVDGETYAIDHQGMFRIKYLYRMPGGGLRLRSENAAEHPDETLSAEEVAKSIRVLGWVWWVSALRRWKG